MRWPNLFGRHIFILRFIRFHFSKYQQLIYFFFSSDTDVVAVSIAILLIHFISVYSMTLSTCELHFSFRRKKLRFVCSIRKWGEIHTQQDCLPFRVDIVPSNKNMCEKWIFFHRDKLLFARMTCIQRIRKRRDMNRWHFNRYFFLFRFTIFDSLSPAIHFDVRRKSSSFINFSFAQRLICRLFSLQFLFSLRLVWARLSFKFLAKSLWFSPLFREELIIPSHLSPKKNPKRKQLENNSAVSEENSFLRWTVSSLYN